MSNIDKQLKNLTKKLGNMKLSLDMDNINAKNIKLVEDLSKALSNLPISKEVTITPKISLGKFDKLTNDGGKLVSEKKRIQAMMDEKFGNVYITPNFNLKEFEKQLKKATKLSINTDGLNLDLALNTTKAEQKLNSLMDKINKLGGALKNLPSVDIAVAGKKIESSVDKSKKKSKLPSVAGEDDLYSSAFRREYGIRPRNLSQALNATVGINTGGKKGMDLQIALEAAVTQLMHQAQKEAYTNPKSDKSHILNQLGKEAMSKLFKVAPLYGENVLQGKSPDELSFNEMFKALKDYGFKLFQQDMDSNNNTISARNKDKRAKAIDNISTEISKLASGDTNVGLHYLNKDLASLNSSDLSDDLKAKRFALQNLLRGVKENDATAMNYLHSYMQGKIAQLKSLQESVFGTDTEATKGLAVSKMQSDYANKLSNDWVTLREAKKHISDAIQRDLQNNDLDKWVEHTAKLEAIKAREKDPYDFDIKKNLGNVGQLDKLLNARRASQDIIYGADSTDDAEIKYLKGLQSKATDKGTKDYLQSRMESLGAEIQQVKEKTAKEIVQYFQDLVNEARKSLIQKAQTPNADVFNEVSEYITANTKLANAKQDTGKLGYGDSAQALSAMSSELEQILGKGNQYSEMLKREAQANTDLLQTIQNNTDALKQFKNQRKELARQITADVGKSDTSTMGYADSASLFQNFKNTVNSEISAGQASGEPVNLSKFKNLSAQYADLYSDSNNTAIANLYRQFAQELEIGSKKIANATKSTLDAENEIVQAIRELDNAYKSGIGQDSAKARLSQAMSDYESAYKENKGTDMTANEKIRLLSNAGSKAGIQKDTEAAEELNAQIEKLRSTFGTTDAKIQKGLAGEAEGQRKVTSAVQEYLNKLRQLDLQMTSTTDTTKLEALTEQYEKLVEKMKEAGKASGEIKSFRQEANILSALSFGSSSKQARILALNSAKKSLVNQEVLDRASSPNTGGFAGTAFKGVYYSISLLGRASKGLGSAFEASSILMKDSSKLVSTSFMSLASKLPEVSAGMAGLGLVAGTIGTTLGVGLTATMAWAAALKVGISSLEFFGGILLDIGKTLLEILKPGIELYRSETKSTYSMMAAIASNASYKGTSLRDMQDQREAMNIAYTGSKQLQDRAKYDAERGAFSYQEIIDALSGTLPMLLAKGMSVQQAYDVNLGVASVAKLINLNPGQVLQEARDLAQGSITAGHSQVANAIGVTNADIKGKDGEEIWSYLMEQFEKYQSVLKEYAQTPVGAFEQMQDRFSIVAEEFVNNFAWSFKGIFDMITNWMGTWKDSVGNILTQIVDPNTGNTKDVWAKYATDENGNQQIESYQDNPTGAVTFNLGDELIKILEGLDEVFLHLAESADRVIGYVKELLGINDVVDTGTDILEVLIDVVADNIMFILWWIDVTRQLLAESEDFIVGLINTGIFIAKVVTSLAYLVVGFKNLIDMLYDVAAVIGNIIRKTVALMKGDIKGAEAIKPLDFAWDNLKQDFNELANSFVQGAGKNIYEAFNKNSYANSFKESRGLWKEGHSSNNNNAITDIWLRGKKFGEQAKEAFAKRKQQGVTIGNLRGTPSSANDDKTDKQKKQAENKAYKRYIAELKSALEAHVQALKDLSEQNEIAYKEGFKSYAEYMTDKVSYSLEEAQAKVNELNAEREAIQNRSTLEPDEKETALYNNQKELTKANATLTKLTRAQEEVAEYLKQSATNMSNVSSQMNQLLAQSADMPTMNLDGSVSVSSNISSLEDLYQANPQNYEEKMNWGLQRLMLAGYDMTNSAAIMANLAMESTNELNPKADNGSHKGIGQWDNDRWNNLLNFASQNQSDPYDFRTQLEFLIHEATTKGMNFFPQIARSMEDAVYQFGKIYERPGDDALNKRQNQAVWTANQAVTNYKPFYKKTVATKDGGESATYNAIQKSLDAGYLGAQLKNGAIACVEAVTKLGAYFSKDFAEAVREGIVNTDILENYFRDKGIEVIDGFSKSMLKAGDTIFFDSANKKNAHVMLYQGNGMLVGNSSSGNNGKGKVVQVSLDNYLAYSGMTPSKIGKSSNTSIFGGNGVSTKTSYAMATTKEGHEARQHAIDTEAKFVDSLAQLEALWMGSLDARIKQIKLKFEKQRINATPEEIDVLNKLEKAEIGKVAFEATSKIIDFNMTNYLDNVKSQLSKLDFSDRGNYTDITSKQADYTFKLTQIKNMAIQNVANSLDRLQELYGYMERQGFISEAQQIKQKIEATLESLYKVFDSAIEKINANYDNMTKRFDNMSWTNLQREQGHKEIEAYRNQALAEQYHTEMTSLQNGYNQLRDEIEACNKEAERLKELGDDKGAQVQLDKVKGKTVELNAVMEKLKSTHALEVLAEEAGHLKDVMEEANDKFKQATEDGLLDFMTDGVNAVLDGTKTIEDAFADMAISILKTMQKFFADKIVTGLMNQWFGNTTTQTLMSPFVYNPEAQWQWSKNPEYVAQQNDKGLAQFNHEGYYITNLPEGGAEEAKQLYKDKQWTPEYASADTTVALTNAVQTNTQAVTELTSALAHRATVSQDNEAKTAEAVENLNETTANTNREISDSVVRGTQLQTQIASNSLAEAITNTTQNNIANQHLASIDASEQKQAIDSSVGGGGGGESISSGGGLSSSISMGIPSVGRGITGTLSNNGGGLFGGIGSFLSDLVDPIYDILEDVIGDVADLLNSDLFARPLNMLNSIIGSAGAQLGGSIFAISSLMDGDRKEQLLSMIFLELQLMYQTLSLIGTYVASLTTSVADIAAKSSSSYATASATTINVTEQPAGHATGGYITGPGTGTSDSIPARLSNGEFVIRSEAVKRYGTNFLNAVNDGTFARIHTKVPRFAEGGLVKEATNNVGNNMAQSMGGVIGQHMSNTATFNVALVRDEQEAMASFMRSSHGQRIMLDFSKKYANVTRSF